MSEIERPRFLGLLNTIALSGDRAAVALRVWAEVTPDDGLARALRLVAARESNHSMLFRQRIDELGFQVLARQDLERSRRLALYASPDTKDADKVAVLSSGMSASDPFAVIEQQMDDGWFDPLTRSLMRWYVDEDRDSARVLRAASKGSAP